jgi:hypothetical protein
MIAMAITGLIVSAIAGALVVSFTTTNVTQQRLAESHDVQVTSAYLANDVQSATGVNPSSGGSCSGASTTLVTFTYEHGDAVYACGTASNGETQVTRTFHSDSVVLAHFAGSARPTVTCAPSCGGTVHSVTMVFNEASGYSYTLVGSRRGYSSGSAGTGSLPPDVTMLSLGSSSPLWVQGGCPNPGTNGACAVDTTATALPISDVLATGWTPTPASPNTLWDKWSDQLDTTWATVGAVGQQAKVGLAPGLLPPDPGFLPLVELRASSAGSGQQKVTMNLYHGATVTPFATSAQITIKNPKDDYQWQLTAAETTAAITNLADLRLGITMTTLGGAGSTVTVYGTALDTAAPAGLLTIRGSLYINSRSSDAVRLTGGTKSGSGATKLTINASPSGTPGDFRIWSPGACSGCSHTTVTCSGCTWNGQQPWTSYSTSLLDPLRSLPAPPVPGYVSCGSVCSPGRYATFSKTTPTTLSPGVYYLDTGISLSGTASLTCPACTGGAGVMLYIAGGSASFTGQSTINLPAANSGMFKDIVMFQARSITAPMKFAGNAGATIPVVLNGIVYVPNSTLVTLATGNATFSAKAIVSQQIKVASPVTIG